MAAPPAKRPPPKAPELGAFPLDHFRECKAEIANYYKCLEAANYIAPVCRDQVREYLTCRMDKGLMEKREVGVFGIPTTEFVETRQEQKMLMEEQLKTGMAQIPVVADHKYPLTQADGYEIVRRAKTGAP